MCGVQPSAGRCEGAPGGEDVAGQGQSNTEEALEGTATPLRVKPA